MDTLWLVGIAQDVDHDLVTDVWLRWCGRRMTAVVGSLRGASSCASFDTSLVRLDLIQGKELGAHVCVGFGDWIRWCINRSSQFSGTIEPGLCLRRSELVVAIASDDHNFEGRLWL